MTNIEKEYEVDRATLSLGLKGIFAWTFDGRLGLMVTSADYLLRIEMVLKTDQFKREGRDVPQLSKRINLSSDVSIERIKDCIDELKGRIGLLPDGYEYVLGPCIGMTSEDEQIFYEVDDDWGIYKLERGEFN